MVRLNDTDMELVLTKEMLMIVVVIFGSAVLFSLRGLGVGPNQQFEMSTQSYRSDARKWLKPSIFLIKIHV